MDADAETQTTPVPSPEPTAAAPPPSLTLGDLQGMVSVISVACERGTFRPRELSAVGRLHDRLLAYLKSQTPDPE